MCPLYQQQHTPLHIVMFRHTILSRLNIYIYRFFCSRFVLFSSSYYLKAIPSSNLLYVPSSSVNYQDRSHTQQITKVVASCQTIFSNV